MTKKKTPTVITPGAFEILENAPEDHALLPEPANGPYLIRSHDGLMVHTKQHWGDIVQKIDKLPLDPVRQSTLKLKANIDLTDLIGQAWSFFRAVWLTRKSEAMVDITWSEETGYRLFVPPQRASGGGVEAKRNAEHYRGEIVGTMHSHCNFSAFHSGTDKHDADEQNGLHITIGMVDKPAPQVVAMISSNKDKWDLSLDQIMAKPLEMGTHPDWWLTYVQDPLPNNKGHISQWTNTGKKNKNQNQNQYDRPQSNGYTGYRPNYHQEPYPNRRNTNILFTSIDSFAFRYTNDLSVANLVNLDACNEIISEVQRALDLMGVDFDYTVRKSGDSFFEVGTNNLSDTEIVVGTVSEDDPALNIPTLYKNEDGDNLTLAEYYRLSDEEAVAAMRKHFDD